MIQLNALGWQARICPEFGMNTVRLCYGEEEILRSPPSEAALAAAPCVYGTPILLPPNRTAGGQFCFEGKSYSLPVNDPAGGNHLHGFLNRTPFAVTRVEPDRVEGYYVNCGEVYPFPFRMDIRAWIDGEGYHQQYRVTNTGGENMPLAFGLHTTFVEKAWISVPIGEKWERDAALIPTGRLLPPDAGERNWREGFSPDGSPVTGFFTAAGHTARIGRFAFRVSENFDQWTLWNGGGQQGFISIEPQQGAVNALNSGTGLKILAPGRTEVYQIDFFPQFG